MADSLERPVLSAANAALDRNGFVAPIDVLTGLGWLRTEHAEAWRRGRVPYLERVTVASLGKLSRALRILRRWAQQRGLQPRETVYVSWTKSRHRLRFTRTWSVSTGHTGSHPIWWQPSDIKRERNRSHGDRARQPFGIIRPNLFHNGSRGVSRTRRWRGRRRHASEAQHCRNRKRPSTS